MKTNLIVSLTKLATKILKLLGKNATSFPGKLALKLNRNILKDLANGYKVIIVTGTNGKTQTTSFIKNILLQENEVVISNEEGANLFQGIVSLFLANYKKFENKEKYAVLEVDEATVKYVTEYIDPVAVVVTNVFIDQTERFSDIGITFDKILDGIKENTTVFLNGDCPTFNSRKIKGNAIFYGFDLIDNTYLNKKPNTDDSNCPICKNEMEYSWVSYSNLGDYYCPKCEFKRPQLDFSVNLINSLGAEHSSFKIGDRNFNLNRGGIYNIYNALCAYSLAKYLNINDDTIQRGFDDTKQIFGRQQKIKIGEKNVSIYLMKNPTGANQLLKLLQYIDEKYTFISVLNNEFADGINYQWIYNTNFEWLNETKIDNIYIGGTRKLELQDRFEKANLLKENYKLIDNNTTDIIDIIKNSKNNEIVIMASYTCLTEIQKYLKSQNYL